jgi:phosphatidylserine decarboxylase
MDMISIHREGKKIARNSFIILLLINILLISGLKTHPILAAVCLIISGLLYLWILYFFRNPTRSIKPLQDTILSPADGKVVVIQPVYEDGYFHSERIQVSIFMSPFNVHVNRSPIAGIQTYFRYHAGKYLVAFHPKSSTKNERTTVVVRRADGKEVMFRQIAGFMARRIRFYPRVGDVIEQGEEVGFIKFGSRLDLFLPIESIITVKLGDQVKAGLSPIAQLPYAISSL